MNQRTVAGLLALVLGSVLMSVAVLLPSPWVRFQPGETLNVLSKYEGKDVIKVTGRKTYADEGVLRMVTVLPDGPENTRHLFSVLDAWLDPDDAVYPVSIYREDETNASVREESAAQMSSSQDFATAAALNALEIPYRTDLVVVEVSPDGAAAKILKKGDVIRAIDGQADADPNVLVNRIREGIPGETITVRILRDGKERDVRITTRPAADDPTSARIGITPGSKFAFPFEVAVQLPGTIGGPSAGLIFALSIYDVLTPGSLTGGKSVAGTGSISPDGVVGSIGGIGQKLIGAQRDGVDLFLVPEENCAEALRSNYDPDKMRLVRVHTLTEAIDAINAWREDPDVDLPRCAS